MRGYVIIPARGGSKGVIGKNIKYLRGKPLIQYTIEAAQEVFSNNNILVSTDCPRIKTIVEELGLMVPFLRPKELARDTSGTYEVLLHALGYLESIDKTPSQIVLLQPTSPFRNGTHIKEALEIFNQNLDMVVSVKESKSNPYFNLREEDADGYLIKSKTGPYSRRQDCPKVWELNGAIYVINTSSLRKGPMNKFEKVKKYVMDEKSSHDIDTQLDWKIAELLCDE